jgi:competence protein ComGC
MIVISIIIILVSVALPQYQKTIMHTRETILSYDLDTMRKLIDQYAADKGKLPQSLDDLVTAGYMRESRRIQLLTTRTGTLSPATIRTRLKAVPESPMCIVLRAKFQPLEPRTANGENQKPAVSPWWQSSLTARHGHLTTKMPANPLDRLLKPRFPSAAVGIEGDGASVVQLDRARGAFIVKRAASVSLPAQVVRTRL